MSSETEYFKMMNQQIRPILSHSSYESFSQLNFDNGLNVDKANFNVEKKPIDPLSLDLQVFDVIWHYNALFLSV